MPLYLMKKNGKIIKDENGRQCYRVRVNYVDSNGVKKQIDRVVFGSAEAKQKERELEIEYKEKKKPTISRMTVKQLYDEYDVYHSNETRKTSHDSTMRSLKLRVLPTLTNVRLDKLSKSRLVQWKNEMSEKDLAITTKQNAYSAFVAMLNYAVKMEYIPNNPLSALGNFRDANAVDKPADTLHYYTSEQFLDYITVAEETAKTVIDWGYYVFFNIAFYTGARKGEINALKWSDIDGKTMHIRRSIAQKLKGGDVETPPKNKSSYRDLQIPDPLMKVLNEHKERQRAASDGLFSEDYRICGGIAPLRDSNLDKKNQAFAKAAGLPHIRIHDFRHSHASLLANEGINIQEIARRLGHSNVQETWNTYSHLYPKEEERAVQVLNKVVKTMKSPKKRVKSV